MENRLLTGRDKTDTKVEATNVIVIGGEREADKTGIAWLGRNTEGWANFLACMKAHLHYNINLRKGTIDFMKQ